MHNASYICFMFWKLFVKGEFWDTSFCFGCLRINLIATYLVSKIQLQLAQYFPSSSLAFLVSTNWMMFWLCFKCKVICQALQIKLCETLLYNFLHLFRLICWFSGEFFFIMLLIFEGHLCSGLIFDTLNLGIHKLSDVVYKA